MAKKYTNKDILKLVEENDVKFIRLGFTDVFGILKNVAITSKQLPRVLEKAACSTAPRSTALCASKSRICI